MDYEELPFELTDVKWKRCQSKFFRRLGFASLVWPLLLTQNPKRRRPTTPVQNSLYFFLPNFNWNKITILNNGNSFVLEKKHKKLTRNWCPEKCPLEKDPTEDWPT